MERLRQMRDLDERCGGDPPSWAELFEEESTTIGDVDLFAMAGGNAHSPAWTLQSADLNVNLLTFNAGEGVQEHRNDVVDVPIVGVLGNGSVTADESRQTQSVGQSILVPKGARRSTTASSERFSDITCHRHRSGLQPTIGKRQAEESR